MVFSLQDGESVPCPRCGRLVPVDGGLSTPKWFKRAICNQCLAALRVGWSRSKFDIENMRKIRDN